MMSKQYYIENMPHVNKSMERVEAWLEQKIIDRAPVRFDSYNVGKTDEIKEIRAQFKNLKDFWFDVNLQIEIFEKSIKGQTFYAESFPIFSPNLGPCVYASFMGLEIEYGADTSWAKHSLDENINIDISKIEIDKNSETWQKIDEITKAALKRCGDKYFVGYTDLHPSLDCVADFTGSENLCIALYDNPKKVKLFAHKVVEEYENVFEYYHTLLKDMPSCNWLGIPTLKKLHIPSCDFASMISTTQFQEFCLPILLKEVKFAPNNIFHLDGAGVAKHIDTILDIKEIKGIQWVQGVGDSQGIMSWIPLIKKIQNAGKSVVVILDESELNSFLKEVSPRGIYLTMKAKYENQADILKIIENWK